jgi:hypothetical protein
MSDDRFLELAPLAALGALDSRESAAFEAHARDCLVCRAELEVHQRLAALIPQSMAPVPPPPGIRRALLEAIARPGERTDSAPARGWLYPALATAAALALGAGLIIVRAERDAARRDAEAAREAAEAASDQTEQALSDIQGMRKDLAAARWINELVADPGSRITRLAGLAPAPKGSAYVVWSASRSEGLLIASGLPSTPEGKTYELWRIALAAPVPAGVFAARSDGTAFLRLPAFEAARTVKSFAVTLEPAGGVPAPTGPMVLSGPVS